MGRAIYKILSQFQLSYFNKAKHCVLHRQVSAPGEVVVDMFAGLGYFSIPLAMAEGLKPSLASPSGWPMCVDLRAPWSQPELG